MLWVGGGILLHGLEELHLAGPIPHLVHQAAQAAGEATGMLRADSSSWLVTALAGAAVEILIGGAIVVDRPDASPGILEELIVD